MKFNKINKLTHIIQIKIIKLNINFKIKILSIKLTITKYKILCNNNQIIIKKIIKLKMINNNKIRKIILNYNL
jgi:hypothetical protein